MRIEISTSLFRLLTEGGESRRRRRRRRRRRETGFGLLFSMAEGRNLKARAY